MYGRKARSRRLFALRWTYISRHYRSSRPLRQRIAARAAGGGGSALWLPLRRLRSALARTSQLRATGGVLSSCRLSAPCAPSHLVGSLHPARALGVSGGLLLLALSGPCPFRVADARSRSSGPTTAACAPQLPSVGALCGTRAVRRAPRQPPLPPRTVSRLEENACGGTRIAGLARAAPLRAACLVFVRVRWRGSGVRWRGSGCWAPPSGGQSQARNTRG